MEDDILFPTAIGCDVHQKTLVCHCKQEVAGTLKNFKATFSTNYNELPKFFDWCSQYKPDTILLESTGIYWCTPFDALEEAHLPVCIVNPAHIKRMIGRKTNTTDAEWLAKVGRCGSFIPSYIPTKEYRELRVLSRNITKLTAEMQSYKNRENKFFVEAGYRLHIFPTVSMDNLAHPSASHLRLARFHMRQILSLACIFVIIALNSINDIPQIKKDFILSNLYITKYNRYTTKVI